MKNLFIIVYLVFNYQIIFAQVVFDGLTNIENAQINDQYFDLDDLNINNPKHIEILLNIGIINQQQHNDLLAFIKQQNISHSYQLQAISSFDKTSILAITNILGHQYTESNKWEKKSELWYRLLVDLEQKKGYLQRNYAGNKKAQLIRLKHQSNRIKFQLNLEKDAGEAYIKHPDYLSWNIHYKQAKQDLIIGDYDINFGQGLISWAGLSFGRSFHIPMNRKVSSAIKPHSGTRELGFFRGIAIRHKKTFGFYSSRYIDANIKDGIIQSKPVSGLHRTIGEISRMSALKEVSFGFRQELNLRALDIGLNSIYVNYPDLMDHHFFAVSIDFNGTFKNSNIFGEVAVNQSKAISLRQGIILSLSKSTNYFIAIGHRSKNHFSTHGEQRLKPGETSMLHIINHKLPSIGKMSFLLNYQKANESQGFKWDAAIQIERKIKLGKLILRYRNLLDQDLQQLRMHWRCQLSEMVELNNRLELNKSASLKTTGHLIYSELTMNIHKHRWGFRITSFDCKEFTNRIYAYEKDILYYFYIPMHYGNGYRYYFNYRYKINRNWQIWIKLSQWNYLNTTQIGSGNELIEGNHKTSLHLQVKLSL